MSQKVEEEDGIVEQLYLRAPDTPDFEDIRRKDIHMVFMYGRLRMGRQGGDLFKNAKYLGEGHTTSEFVVRIAPLQYPLAFPMNTVVGQRMSIIGDIWAVDPLQLASIDTILCRANPGFFRKKYFVSMHDQHIPNVHFRPSVEAWTYLGDPNYWRPVYMTSPKSSHTGHSKSGKPEFDFQGHKGRESWPDQKP